MVLIDLFKAGEDGLVLERDQLVAAEVVGAAFHIADAEIADEGFKEGNVAEVELVLEGLGTGGDNDALAGSQGGKQVGQGLAGAGSGLDDEVTAFSERALDRLGHFELARAVLIGQRRTRQDSARREKLVEGGQGAG